MQVLKACSEIFDRSPQPFGVARLHVDDAGVPFDFSYAYLNPAMAALTNQTVDELLGRKVYEMWGGDTTWLDVFYRAAYHDEPCEFEAVSVLLHQFLHAQAFPLSMRGYCGFMVNDLTDMLMQANLSTSVVAAYLFFYDMRTNLIMLTPSACEAYGLSSNYTSLTALARELFGPESEREIHDRTLVFKDGGADILYEGMTLDGRWIQLSVGHVGETNRFGMGLLEDVTRRKHVEEGSAEQMRLLRRQKAALEDALTLAEHGSRAKSTFLTNMSHDFRTPMNSISGFAGIALAHLDEPERVRDCLNKIIRSSGHLLNLVNDILDMSRIESGKVVLEERPIDLVDMLQGMEVMFSDQAAERGMAFAVSADEVRDRRVMVDELRLNQIMVNIIGNAFKFTPDGGMVEVKVWQHAEAPSGYGRYSISVIDTGCGMKPGFEETLFNPFEREGAGYAGRTEGTGLGMAITRNLVDMMGGTLDVTSQVGQGSEFVVTVPLRLAEASEGDVEVAAATDADVRDGYGFDGKHALVVDDDELSREVMCEILKQYGFTVEEAADGDVAVDAIAASEAGAFDVVIMDMRMRRMDGDEATRAIRELPREDVAALPVIAVTADAFEESAQRAKAVGMNGHTTKPLNVRNLLNILKDILD